MTEVQNSLEPGANGVNGATPQEAEAVATSNATTDNSHQVGTVKNIGEATENKQNAHNESLDAASTKQSSDTQRTPAARFCPKCGASLKEGMPFCGACGAKIGNAVPAPTKTSDNSNAKFKMIAGIITAVVVIVLIAVFAIPALTMTPQKLISEGDFEKAYSTASNEQKQDVLVANLATVVSKDLIDVLDDPSSFKLDNIYFDKYSHEMILEASAADHSGDSVSLWLDYRFDDDNDAYQFYLGVGDLEDEAKSKYDTSYERSAKDERNDTRKDMRKIIADDSMKVNNDYVDSINKLHEVNAEFKDVKLVSSINGIYPSDAAA